MIDDIEIMLGRIVGEIASVGEQTFRIPPPSYNHVSDLLEQIKRVIFDVDKVNANKLAEAEKLYRMMTCVLSQLTQDEDRVSISIMEQLPSVKRRLITDAVAIYRGDPAAGSISEIMVCYPGFYASTVYRIAHLFYAEKIPFVPRMMSELAHRNTGIDIHPGARIGEGLCIDHGTGVVIGETAVIGNRVKIYQGVTIGAKSFEADESGALIKGKKRHPNIGNDCVIYAGATILGGDTVIGDGCVIGGNVWLTHSVPPGTTVLYNEK